MLSSRIVLLAISTILAGSLASRNAYARSDAEFVAKYENNKPVPGGIRPSTKGEYTKCWMAWKRLGSLAIASKGGMAEMHADWNAETADAIFQHWWKKAEDAYGKNGKQKMLDKAQEYSDYLHDTSKTNEMLEMSGVCYVTPQKRLTFKKKRPLDKFLKASRPNAKSTKPAPAAPAKPAKPAPGSWKYVYGKAVGKVFTCRDHHYQTDALAKANAKEVCRKSGGTPDNYPVVTNSGYDAYKANADKCYEAYAKVRCDY